MCKELGVSLGDMDATRFADGEIRIRVKENIRYVELHDIWRYDTVDARIRGERGTL